jgi:hypothetical protein
MSVELVLSQARNGNPVLSVKGFDRGLVVEVARRVNTWLDKAVVGWKPYTSQSYPDQGVPGMFYVPVPLSHAGVCVSPMTIATLCKAMQKANVCFVYRSSYLPYTFEVEIPETKDTYTTLGMVHDLHKMTKRAVETLLAGYGITPPVRMSKKALAEWASEVELVTA